MNSASNIPLGTVIKGKWHNHHYRIAKELGKGANGVVYLADAPNGQVAIKVSDDSMLIASEVNVLKSFSKAPVKTMGPSFYDMDDAIYPGMSQKCSFYVMEYVRGPLLLDFVKQKGDEWIVVLMVQLLSNLAHLHKEGWIFGDLKPDNLIVSGPPATIRCVDVGGTTKAGRAIKEYTEFFDRGYWGFGTRKAEPTYDLFALCMVMVNCAYKKEFKKGPEPKKQLYRAIEGHPLLKRYEGVLKTALQGKYQTATDMKSAMLREDQILATRKNHQKKPTPKRRHSPAVTQKHNATSRSRVVAAKRSTVHKKSGGLFETILIVCSVLALYCAYVVLFLL
ncbi:protein kinase family protein [Bacillus sp. NPDC093026]|uniref:protein kinase domain-containing protein n=1 Tax=Bacillus sp. NPDC093026 TaxID=3363948 RepID=UPI00381A10EF